MENAFGASGEQCFEPHFALQRSRRTKQQVYVTSLSIVIRTGAKQQNLAIFTDFSGDLLFEGVTLFRGQAHGNGSIGGMRYWVEFKGFFTVS